MFKSTALWLIALFGAANLAWVNLNPLKQVPHTALPSLQLAKAALRYKAGKLAQVPAADILIVGSSLPMCAFFYCEAPPYFDNEEGLRIRSDKLNLFQSYPYANYFAHAVSKAAQKPVSVFNFAGAACMASDLKLVLSRALEAGKKPKIIIYGVGLRDFNDNVNAPPGETPYFKALTDFSFLTKHFLSLTKFPSFSDLWISSLCNLYKLRDEFKLSAEHYACVLFKHPSSAEIAFNIGQANDKLAAEKSKVKSEAPAAVTAKAALQPSKAVPVEAAASSKTLNGTQESSVPLLELDYKQRYCPANYKQFDQEMAELNSFIDSCSNKGIKVVLINMPVSSGHKSISPPGLRDAYILRLAKLSKKAALYLDYEGKQYPDSYFFDTVHLSPEGATEFADSVAEKLAQSGLLTALK